MQLLTTASQFCVVLAAIAVTLLYALSAPVNAFDGWPEGAPESVGADAEILQRIDSEALQGIQRGQMPGCVIVVGLRGRIVYFKAYGERQIQPESAVMATDTVFDLASLTKPIATATSVMILLQHGKVQLDDPVTKHVPEFSGGEHPITIKHLLTHQSGLIADNPLRDYQNGADAAWKKIWLLKPNVPPEIRFTYSDVNFLMLGKLVERVSGEPLDKFAKGEIFEPLGMHETGYLPSEELRNRAAPTEKRDGRWLQGEVHDPRAALLGGVAGHAGLFSTGHDLSRYAAAMAEHSKPGPGQLLTESVWLQMTRRRSLDGINVRGLSWDMQSSFSSNRGDGMSRSAFGHGGFTGTSMWIDPERQLFVIFLSNRLHPDGKGAVNQLAGRIGTIAVEAAQGGK